MCASFWGAHLLYGHRCVSFCALCGVEIEKPKGMRRACNVEADVSLSVFCKKGLRNRFN